MRGELLPGFSIRRPVTVAMIGAALLVLGMNSWREIRRELIPSGFTPPFLYAQINTLPGTPSDLEREVAIPIEEMLSTVRDVKSMSVDINANTTSFLMEFVDGTDMDTAYNQVRDRIERGIGRVEVETGPWFIWKYNPNEDPVTWFGVTMDESIDDPQTVIESRLVPLLERLPGVSRVDVFGLNERRVAIEVSNRLAAGGGGAVQLIDRLRQDNFSLAGGSVMNAGRELPLRVVSRFSSLAEIAGLPAGGGLRISDIGSVGIESATERRMYRINRRPAVFLGVYRDSAANIVDVASSIREALTSGAEQDPVLAGIEPHYFFDQGVMITDSLRDLQTTALWGGLFAVFVLAIFLRHARATLLITTAIPSSLLMATAVLHLSGRSLNVLSLTGMMLAVGLVVDNAIVVVESIQSYRARGFSARRAALRGASEVSLPIVVATLTTVVVFLPLTLMTGSETLTFYLSEIGVPVCAGLIASLIVSLLFLPVLAARIGGDSGVTSPRWLLWLQEQYARALRFVLIRRADAFFVAMFVFATVLIPMTKVATTDQMQANINDIRVSMEFAPGMSWDDRVAACLSYEEAIWTRREELGIRDLRVGLGSSDIGGTPVRAFLLPPEQRDRTREEVIAQLQAVLPVIPGVTHAVSTSAMNPAQASGPTVAIRGPDSAVLREIGDQLSERLLELDGVLSVIEGQADPGATELQLAVDRASAFRSGTDGRVVGLTLDYAMRGRELSDFRGHERRLPIVVRGVTTDADDRDEIGLVEVPGAVGTVPISTLTSERVLPATLSIHREDGSTLRTLEITTGRDDLDALAAEIDEVAADIPLPRGYSIEKGSRFKIALEGGQERNMALYLAIAFVFILMAVLFESFVLPLSVLLAVPFAVVGVYWSLYLTGTSLDVMVAVGLLILVGIVVNNAIVVVDLAREQVKAGEERIDALVFAGRQRLRPVLMTALTTICGLIPMAMGKSTLIGIPYSPLGRAVIGGLTISTLLTLFVVPIFYTFFDDLGQWVLARVAPHRSPPVVGQQGTPSPVVGE